MFKSPEVKQFLHKLISNISSSPIRKRIVKGLGANVFAQAINIVIQLTSVPIFLHFWGADLYGKWLILSSIPGYLSMSDIGFGSVAGNEMTMLTARKDYQAATKVFQSAWVFITGICSVIGLVAYALAYLLPFDSWFNLKSLPPGQVSLVICLLAFYTLVSQQGGLIDAAFKSDGRYAQGTALDNIVRLMEMVLALSSVALGGQLVSVALMLLIGRTMGLCWMWLVFKRGSQWLSLGYAKASWQTIQKMFKPAIAFMAIPLSNALIFQGMTLTVGGLLAPVAVVVFTTSRTVSRILIQFITLINCAFWPELSAAFGCNDLQLARKLHQRASLFSFWLSIVTSIALAAIGPWLLRFWTGGHIVINLPLFYLMLLLVISSSLWQSSSVFLMATNTHGSLAKITLISSIGGIIIAYIFMNQMGIIAAPIALLTTDIAIGFYAIKNTLNLLKSKFTNYFRSLFNLKTALS